METIEVIEVNDCKWGEARGNVSAWDCSWADPYPEDEDAMPCLCFCHGAVYDALQSSVPLKKAVELPEAFGHTLGTRRPAGGCQPTVSC